MLINQLKNIDIKQKTNRGKFGFYGQRLLGYEGKQQTRTAKQIMNCEL